MRKHALAGVAAVVLLLVCAAPSALAQEVEVPLDSDGRFDVIDARLAQRLGMFEEYTGFQEARLFRNPSGDFVLVVRFQQDGKLVQERQPMTVEEVAAFRQTVAERLVSVPERTVLDQSGRVPLLLQSALLSLSGYGPSLVAVLDIEEPASAGALVLLAGGAGFFAPYALTRTRPVSRPAANLTTTGALLGYFHGAAFGALLRGEDATGRLLAGLGMAASIGEAVAAHRFATETGMTLGTTEVIGSGGLFGAGAGIVTAALVLGDNVDTDAAVRAFAGLALVGSAAGIYSGYRLSRTEPYTEGDARILATAGALGFMAGQSALLLVDVETVRPAAAALLATTAAGLALGQRLTTGRDFTPSQGNFIGLGTLAGGLVGAAIATLAEADEGAALALSTAGAGAGFGIMYGGFRHSTASGPGSLRMALLPGAMRTNFGPGGIGFRPSLTLRVGL